jgi:hypothetical protein|tara:strand:- start:505 stop:1536 length:1032 start_codon:yes stop_codon:yes gene_type:complete
VINLKNKFAIGCLVQWYEIELVEEYLQSIKNTLDTIGNKKNVIVDLYFNCDQTLEKIDEKQITISDIKKKYNDLLNSVFGYDEDVVSLVGCEYNINTYTNNIVNRIYTIADYRRDFNDNYCDKVDVLMWGETDSLIPRQTFQVLDNLHSSVKEQTPKYVAFFATCKMWDKSWEVVEHPEFTVKPFIDMDRVDTENWWSLRYNMNIDEMNSFNDKVEDLDIKSTTQLKFNGCGLVISSDVVKSGVNIPRGSFFVHEDTAFMNNLLIMFQGKLPQYIIKNILLVHNRKHIKKRKYIEGEGDVAAGDIGGARKQHDWYMKANELSEYNAHNIFNQTTFYTWDDVFK